MRYKTVTICLFVGLITIGAWKLYDTALVQAQEDPSKLNENQVLIAELGQQAMKAFSSGQYDTAHDKAAKICRDIAAAYEERLSYPGEIKVTVIRESRFLEMAK